MSHWRTVARDGEYRERWLYNALAATSSWFFVVFWGGHYGGTVSAEIERRRLEGRKLGAAMWLIRLVGSPIFGRAHWAESYERETRWLRSVMRPEK